MSNLTILQKTNLGGIPFIKMVPKQDVLITTDGKDVWDELIREGDEIWIATYTVNSNVVDNQRVHRILTGDKDAILPRFCKAEVRYLALNHIKMAILFRNEEPPQVWIGSHNAVGSHLIDLMYRVRDRDATWFTNYYRQLWSLAK